MGNIVNSLDAIRHRVTLILPTELKISIYPGYLDIYTYLHILDI